MLRISVGTPAEMGRRGWRGGRSREAFPRMAAYCPGMDGGYDRSMCSPPYSKWNPFASESDTFYAGRVQTVPSFLLLADFPAKRQL